MLWFLCGHSIWIVSCIAYRPPPHVIQRFQMLMSDTAGDPKEADPETGAAFQDTSPANDPVIPDAPNREQAFSRQVQLCA